MLRKTMFALGSVIFLAATVAASSAQARMGGFGGGFHGGGFHGGGFHGGGFHGGGFHGGGFRGAAFHGGFRGGFAGPRFAAHPRFFHNRFVRFHRFHHRRFAFAAVPVFVGGSYYYDSCWVVRYTPWGLRRVYVCGDY